MLEANGDDIVGHLDGNMHPVDALAEDVDMFEPQENEDVNGLENPVEMDLVVLSPPLCSRTTPILGAILQ
jgi:hypothetical protein